MIRAIIVDDEKHAIVTLSHLINKTGGIEILEAIQESTRAKSAIEKWSPDIVFLDIEMPLMNGFDLLSQFSEISFKVIFTTAYDQYAIRALKMNALDYLLKPIDEEEFQEAIGKYKKNELFTTTEQIANLSRFKMTQLSETLALSTQGGLTFIKVKDIIFMADGSYTHILMSGGDKHMVSKSLSNFEEVLQDNPVFFRPHKSYLVNLNFVKRYIRGEGGELIMENKKSIAVSRNKKQEFLDLFKKI